MAIGSFAWQDTDGDRQPDELNCPDGTTTDLFEDQDDDGDGIPDTLRVQPVTQRTHLILQH